MASRASSRVVPEALPSLRLIFQPLNQVICGGRETQCFTSEDANLDDRNIVFLF